MKLKDIVTHSAAKKAKASQHKQARTKNHAAAGEVLALIRADDAGLVNGCPLLADDELELLACILTRLCTDKSYQPSPMPMQLIADGNTRIWTSAGAAVQ